jgi:hypothetical protein
MKQRVEIDGISDDIGPLLVYPLREAALAASQLPRRERAAAFVADWLPLDFKRHPVRDTLATLAVGGLGVAVGAAAFSRRS